MNANTGASSLHHTGAIAGKLLRKHKEQFGNTILYKHIKNQVKVFMFKHSKKMTKAKPNDDLLLSKFQNKNKKQQQHLLVDVKKILVLGSSLSRGHFSTNKFLFIAQSTQFYLFFESWFKEFSFNDNKFKESSSSMSQQIFVSLLLC